MLILGPLLRRILVVLSCLFGAVSYGYAADWGRDGFDPEAVAQVYADRGGDPIWWESGKGLTPRGIILVSILSHADLEGLRVSDYISQNQPDAKNQPSGEVHQDHDRSLTAGLLRYISDIRDGRQSGRNADPELIAIPRLTDAVALLKSGLEAKEFATWLSNLPPKTKQYQNLRGHLERYRKLAVIEWPALVRGKKIELGSIDPNVRHIRARLKMLGDLPTQDEGEGDLLDEALNAAVIRFQTRHGLAPDGVIGPQTYAALNVSPETRSKQIIVSMERMRWLPENLGARYVMVNIAGFELTAVSGDIDVLRMPVIVGRDQRRTPVLNDKIVNIVFRPTWTVPVKIARNDLLPKIKADANYLTTMGLRVFRSWQDGAPEVDPQTVDWPTMASTQFNFKFRQDPGPKNALGLMRFTLTNPYDIYLHDTPEKNLFAKPGRAFSSGCIRVSDVVALADFALEAVAEWRPDSIRDAMNANVTRVVKLPVSLPIYIVYSTVTAENADTLHFREDIYGRDTALMRALALTDGR